MLSLSKLFVISTLTLTTAVGGIISIPATEVRAQVSSENAFNISKELPSNVTTNEQTNTSGGIIPGEYFVKISEGNISAETTQKVTQIIQEVTGDDNLQVSEILDGEAISIQSPKQKDQILNQDGFVSLDLNQKEAIINKEVEKVKQNLEPIAEVEYIVPEVQYTNYFTPTDDRFATQYALENNGTFQNVSRKDADIDASVAWNYNQGSKLPESSILIMEVDGVPAVSAELTQNFLGVITAPGQQTNGGAHASAVASVAAASANGSGMVGSCPNCGLYFAQLNGTTSGQNAVLYYLLSQPIENIAQTVNMSFGVSSAVLNTPGATEYYQDLQVLINQRMLNGVTFVASAGNSGTTDKTLPASLEGVISVAASNKNDTVANYSNYGDWIDITAPGTDILTNVGDQYAYQSGTSFSAPIVSGIVAMMNNGNPALNPFQITNRLKNNADNITSLNPTRTGLFGTGRANALRAIKNATGVSQAPIVQHFTHFPALKTFEQGQYVTIRMRVRDYESYVKNIKVYRNGVLIRVIGNPTQSDNYYTTFRITLNQLGTANYKIVATDTENNVVTSNIITLNVKAAKLS